MLLLLRLSICCIFTSCLAQKLTISQNPPLILTTVDKEANMYCEQVTTDHDQMYWYHQEGGQGLKLIAYIIRGQTDAFYEGKNKDFYEVGRHKGDKYSSLRVKPPTNGSQGVYFCASTGTGGSGGVQYFGEGTIVHVLGEKEKQIEPKVRLFPPDKQEFKEHSLLSLVCVASGFFPEHVRLTWYLNNEKIESLYQNVPKRDENNTYSTSSRLSLTESQYFNPDTKIRCEAAFVGSNITASDETHGELGCGVSKESYGMYMNQGKISYIMVLFKSGLYALIVMAVIWRRKALSGSC